MNRVDRCRARTPCCRSASTCSASTVCARATRRASASAPSATPASAPTTTTDSTCLEHKVHPFSLSHLSLSPVFVQRGRPGFLEKEGGCRWHSSRWRCHRTALSMMIRLLSQGVHRPPPAPTPYAPLPPLPLATPLIPPTPSPSPTSHRHPF